MTYLRQDEALLRCAADLVRPHRGGLQQRELPLHHLAPHRRPVGPEAEACEGKLDKHLCESERVVGARLGRR